MRVLLIQTQVSYELNLIAPRCLYPAKLAHELHPIEAKKALESEQILVRNLKNEMRGIRQQIDKERNPRKKTEMIKAYRKMSKTLSGW